MGYNLGDWEKPPLEELMHYGVKGMKWGHHKYTAPSEEVVKARKNVKQRKDDLKKARKKERRESLYGLTRAPKETVNGVTRAVNEYRYSKEDLASVKILNRLKSKPKSETQLKLEEKYKKKGMSDDEAAVAAYKNIRTRKVLAVVGGVAVVSLTAYGAYKFHDNRVDKIIKSGTLLQNMSEDYSFGIRDAFYSSSNKLDNVKYRGLYGNSLLRKRGVAVQKEIKVLSDIRQASHKNAHITLKELIKTDKDFADGVQQYMAKGHRFGDTYGKKAMLANASLRNGKVDKNVYEVFNAALVDHSPRMQSLTDKYYEALSKKGYNALKDINDSKYSGYKSLNPVIAFNTSGKVDVIDIKKVTDEEIRRSAKIAYAHIYGTDLVEKGAKWTGIYLGGKAAINTISNKANTKAVEKYRKDHPGTQMTNTEIIRMLERSKIK